MRHWLCVIRVWLCVIAVATAATVGIACSSNGPSSPSGSTTDSGADGAADKASADGLADSAADKVSTDGPTDSAAAEAAPLSADCQRLYDCCVGPAAQTAQFCTELVAQNICGVWLQSYAMAGIHCA
jgi:hypothetical protein